VCRREDKKLVVEESGGGSKKGKISGEGKTGGAVEKESYLKGGILL